MFIKIDELFEITQMLEYRIKEVYQEGIEIPDDDYYWFILDEDKYNPYNTPEKLNLGQLSFDWDELMDLKKETQNNERVPISYHLGCLAEILLAIKKNSSGVW